MSDLDEILESAPDNIHIVEAFVKGRAHLRNHEKVLVSVSGGSDSDVMMDLLSRCGHNDKIQYVFFDTGLEYAATKKQIAYLNDKYGVEINKIPPIKPIPTCVKEFGVPFWSKHVSEMMYRLQQHGFRWEDEPFEELILKYPGCQSALQWWCNEHKLRNGGMSSFNIGYTSYLKEFIVSNPPKFKISNRCCTYAKKKPAENFIKRNDFDLNCVGVRKAEGGIRSKRYTRCYTKADGGVDQYRPLFWFTDEDKREYEQHYSIKHSDCYEMWGMDRTGCAGCPFSKKWKNELELAEKYEPKFHKAMLNVFGESYEYTRQFEMFREEKKQCEKLQES